MKSAGEEDNCQLGVPVAVAVAIRLLSRCSDPKGQFGRNHRKGRMIDSWFQPHTEHPPGPRRTGSRPRAAWDDTAAASAPSAAWMEQCEQRLSVQDHCCPTAAL